MAASFPHMEDMFPFLDRAELADNLLIPDGKDSVIVFLVVSRSCIMINRNIFEDLFVLELANNHWRCSAWITNH